MPSQIASAINVQFTATSAPYLKELLKAKRISQNEFNAISNQFEKTANKMVKDSAKVESAFSTVSNSIENSANQAKRTKKPWDDAGNIAQQAGYQFADAAVQIEMGTNAFRVIGQQGSQFAAFFGPAGAVIGAVLAVGTAIAATLVPELMEAEDATKDLKEAQEILNDTFSISNGIFQGLSDDLVELYKRDKDLAELKMRQAFIAATSAIKSTRKEAFGLFEEFDVWANNFDTVTESTFDELDAAAKRSGKTLAGALNGDLYATGLTTLRSGVSDIADSLDITTAEAIELSRAMVKMRDGTGSIADVNEVLYSIVTSSEDSSEKLVALANSVGKLSLQSADAKTVIDAFNKLVGTDLTKSSETANAAFKDLVEEMGFEMSMLRKSELEQYKLTAARRLGTDATDAQIEAVKNAAEALYKEKQATEELKNIKDELAKSQVKNVVAVGFEVDISGRDLDGRYGEQQAKNQEALNEKLEKIEKNKQTKLIELNDRYRTEEARSSEEFAQLQANIAQAALDDRTEAIKEAKEKDLDIEKDYNKKLAELRINAIDQQLENNVVSLFDPDSIGRENELLQEKYTAQLSMLDEKNLTEAEKTLEQNKLMQEYGAARVQNEMATYSAIKNLVGSIGNEYMSMSESLSGASDEEKKQIKKNFLIKKAGAIAQAGIDYAMTLMAIETAAASIDAMTMGVGGKVYMATAKPMATAQFAMTTGMIAASTLGGLAAFNVGSENIPKDQLAFVHKSERIIQPNINSDLTSYLDTQKRNGMSGGSTTINAPINIQRVNNDDEIMRAVAKYPQEIAALNIKGGQQRPTKRRR